MVVRRALAAGLAAAVTGLVVAAGASGAEPLPVTVTADPTQVSTQLGESFSFDTTITSTTGSESEPLVAHLNLLSLRGDVYVDPEDWSSERTRYIGTLPAGESRTLTWTVKAVNGGDLAAYVTVLEQDSPTLDPATSPPVRIEVATRDTLNSGGILPLALGIPIALGALAGAIRVRRGRR